MYDTLLSWLTPPYLYLVINGIIISIAASSRFHKSGSGSGSEPAPATNVKLPQEFVVVPATSHEQPVNNIEEVRGKYENQTEYSFTTVTPAVTVKEVFTEYSSLTPEKPPENEVAEVPTEYSIQTVNPTTRFIFENETTEYSFPTPEKPPVSSRLGRRKSLKSTTPEAGKSLRVARPKKNDTLENTWRAITDGRSVPLARHLKKSDTWETRHTRVARDEPAAEPVMRKCETFNERGGADCKLTMSSSPVLKKLIIRKEPSLGQDELNRKVEAFINKFNADMRMQRQESLQQYMDMINRGSH